LLVVALWGAGQADLIEGQFLSFSDLIWTIAIVLANGIVAMLIIRRYPRHFVGWALLVVSFSNALMQFSGSFATSYANPTPALSTPGVIFFGWVARWIWLPVAVTPFVLIPHFFPDGRLLSKRWRIPAAAAPAGLLVAIISWAVNPVVSNDIPVPNPVDVGLNAAQAVLLFEGVAMPLFWVASLSGFASVFLRYRRSGPVRRAQMKWVLYVLGVMFSISVVEQLLPAISPEGLGQLLEELDYSNRLVWIFSTVIPIAMGIAIMRYRLFDIDLIIRRTLIYGVVTASLAAVYFGSVVLLQRLSTGVSGEQSPLIIVISTLLIAALFSPLRRRAQELIDRRFYRAKYDMVQTLAGFAQTARDETNLDALTGELAAVVRTTMQPESVGVWLRSEVDGDLVRDSSLQETRP
jgi:hypothetical protein